jgi:hypothetical protein
MKILFGHFIAKIHMEDFFKPAIGKERLHKISNINEDRSVNFETSKNITVKRTMFPHYNIILLGRILMDRLTIKLTIYC